MMITLSLGGGAGAAPRVVVKSLVKQDLAVDSERSLRQTGSTCRGAGLGLIGIISGDRLQRLPARDSSLRRGRRERSRFRFDA